MLGALKKHTFVKLLFNRNQRIKSIEVLRKQAILNSKIKCAYLTLIQMFGQDFPALALFSDRWCPRPHEKIKLPKSGKHFLTIL